MTTIAQLDEALTAAYGDRGNAAAALGITEDYVRKKISRYPALKAKWGLPEEKSDRAPVIRRKGAFDWSKIGVTGEGAELMESFEQSVGMTFMGMIGVAQGGTWKQYANLCLQADYVAKKLSEIRTAPPNMLTNPETGETREDLSGLELFHRMSIDLSNVMLKFQATALATEKEKIVIQAKMDELRKLTEPVMKKVLATRPPEFMTPKPETPALPAPTT